MTASTPLADLIVRLEAHLERFASRDDDIALLVKPETRSKIAADLREAARLLREREWQPIETAPRDGRMVLLLRPLAERSHDPVVAIRRSIASPQHCWPATVPDGADGHNYTDGACYATHWMPLPTPPEGSTP